MKEINIKDLIKHYLKYSYIIIIATILTLLLGEMKLKKVTPIYESTTKITISNFKKDITNKKEITDLQLFENYKSLVISADFVRSIIDNNDLKLSVDASIANTSLVQEEGTTIFDIKFLNSDRYLAQKYNDKLTNSFVATLKKYKITSAKIIQNTTTTNKPINIDYNKKRATYIVVGIIIGFVIVFIIFYFDGAIKSKDELDDYNVLGTLPKIKNKKFRDMVNVIKSKILLGNGETKIILFTSVNKTNGVSILLKELTKECAKNNKILCIDANIRKNNNKPGYSNLIQEYNGKVKIDDYAKVEENLTVIGSGTLTSDTDSLLSSKNNIELINSLRNKYDYIFIKSCELNDKSDSLVLSKLVDKVIVLVNEDVTKYKDLEDANKSFKQIDEKIDGIVYSKIKK